MKYVFDLREQYLYEQRFHFYPNAVAALQLPDKLGNTLSFLVWGVIIDNPGQHPGLVEQLSTEVQSFLPTPLYLAGWGVIEFQQLVGGKALVSPFAPVIDPGDMKPAYDCNGKAIHFLREWEKKSSVDNAEEYDFEFQLEQPRAYIQFRMEVAGPISLEIDPKDCVTFKQACTERATHDHDWTRTRQLSKQQNDINELQ